MMEVIYKTNSFFVLYCHLLSNKHKTEVAVCTASPWAGIVPFIVLKYTLILLTCFEWLLKWLSVCGEQHYHFVIYMNVA